MGVKIGDGDNKEDCKITDDKDDINDAIFDDEDTCIFPDPPVIATQKCGKRNKQGVDTSPFFEGPSFEEANFGEWPHVCAILKSVTVGEADEYVQVYLCGASLIAPQVVLTSGHCVNDTDTKHPDLDVDNHHNNFALLFMSSAFETGEENPHISPICLPQPGKKPFNDEYCVSHGWGKDEFGSGGKYQTRLKEVVVPIVANRKCQDDLRSKTRLGEYYELTRASSVLAASWAWTRAKVMGAVLWFVRNSREPGIRLVLSPLVLDVERLASLLSMLMCPLLPAGLIDRFPSSMVRLKDPLTLDLPKKIVQNLVKNLT